MDPPHIYDKLGIDARVVMWKTMLELLIEHWMNKKLRHGSHHLGLCSRSMGKIMVVFSRSS